MKYKIIFLFVVSFFFQEVKSQDFKSDWNVFSSEKYNVEFSEDKTTYASLDNIGELHFKSKIDPSKFIIYYVFNREKITGAFESGDTAEQIQSFVQIIEKDTAFFFIKNITI